MRLLLIRRERYSGSMQRAITLDTPVDEARANAYHENGMLRLTLSKSQATPQRKIAIH